VIHPGSIFFPFKRRITNVSTKIKLMKIAPYPRIATIPSIGGKGVREPVSPFTFLLISTNLKIAAMMQQILQMNTSLLNTFIVG
jgi:hypothetical protein